MWALGSIDLNPAGFYRGFYRDTALAGDRHWEKPAIGGVTSLPEVDLDCWRAWRAGLLWSSKLPITFRASGRDGSRPR